MIPALWAVSSGVFLKTPHPSPLGNCSLRCPTFCIHAVVPQGEGVSPLTNLLQQEGVSPCALGGGVLLSLLPEGEG
jgi:hypothetical protein